LLPALALCLGLLALTLLSAAPEMGWFDVDQRTRAALGVARLGLGATLLALMARRAGYEAAKVALVGIPILVVVSMLWFTFRPPLLQVELSALPSGEAIYVGLCADCHGEMGTGRTGPSLDDDPWLLGSGSEQQFLGALGEHDLPLLSMFSEQEQAELLAYLVGLQTP
jgi:cytochrome c553